MKSGSQDCLTPQHLQLFGTIVQWFARYELLMQEFMAKLAGSETSSVMLLTRRLDFGGNWQALLICFVIAPILWTSMTRSVPIFWSH